MAEPLKDLQDALDACVHCGFCLPTCPTYELTGLEAESPRGRLFQMKAWLDGTVSSDDPHLVAHLDSCLDCRSCESACPAGVGYGRALEAVRAELPQAPEMRGFGRLLRLLFSSPRRLRLTGMILRLLSKAGLGRLLRLFSREPRWQGALSLLPTTPGPLRRVRLPAVPGRRAGAAPRAVLLEGCVMGEFFGRQNQAAYEALSLAGVETCVPRGQGCCGALHLHAGDRKGAQELARALITAVEGEADAWLVTTAAGCGSTLKEYGALLSDDPQWSIRAQAFAERVRDFSEVLAALPRRPRGRFVGRVAYHDACHLRHAQRVVYPPRQLLAEIEGLELVELSAPWRCCGSAGSYMLTHPQAGDALLSKKMTEIAQAAPDIVVTANPGCLLQLQMGARQQGPQVPIWHLAEILARAYREGARPNGGKTP